jgi:endonuclease/exonuclease/phosphatase family metal-dependent hydrolase
MQDKLTVMTYNVRMVELTVTKNPGRAKKILKRLKPRSTDIIVFNELFTNKPKNILLDGSGGIFSTRSGGLKDNGYEFTSRPKDPSKKRNGGVIIGSRYPIIESDTHVFSAGAEDTSILGIKIRYHAKGIVYAKIRKDNKHYHLFGTHLQHDNDPNQISARIDQIKELGTFIKQQNCPENEPVIIAGDFNTDADTVIKNLEKTGIYANKKPLDKATTIAGTKLDHIFYANSKVADDSRYYIIEWYVDDGLPEKFEAKNSNGKQVYFLSDHHPLEAVFKFDESPSLKAARNWIGTYTGRNDGRSADLTIELASENYFLDITFRDLDRNAQFRGQVPINSLSDGTSSGHILKDLTLSSSDGTESTKKVERLFLHTWDNDHISGYTQWEDNNYGLAFSKSGVKSPLGDGSTFDRSQWVEEWIGSYSGFNDGRNAKLTIKRSDQWLEFTLADLDRNVTFTGSTEISAQESSPPHILENLQLTASDGNTKEIVRLFLHTWDIHYISGYNVWNSTYYGSFFVKE